MGRRRSKTTWPSLSATGWFASRRDAATWSRLSETRKLRFEPLEDRRLLAIIADTFADSFVQTYRLVGVETAILTADAVGQNIVFYRPNNELGYINPANGDLLSLDFYPGLSNVLVVDGEATGNVSQLVGQLYSNGQLIAADGGNTVYHRDGSIMRSGGTWTYDAGATLESGANLFWSNGTAMNSGATLFHPNGSTLRSGTSLFYATGATFQTGTTLSFADGQSLRDAAGNYKYESGDQQLTSGVLHYPVGVGGVMVDATGTVHNEDGNVSITPFSRYHAFDNSETFTSVTDTDSQTTVAILNTVGGFDAAYVSHFNLTYNVLPPDPPNIVVTAPDPQTLRFTWTTGGGSTVGYRVAVANGTTPPSDPSAGFDSVDNFYELTSLAAGQKVSIRVWARDAGGQLSHPVDATGTAGKFDQSKQTGALIESGLASTLIQTYESSARNIVFTVDQDNNFYIFLWAGDELGYVNPENGDRLERFDYEMPGSPLENPNISDFRVIGNISSIPLNAHYVNGQPIRSGDTFYYDTGVVLRSAALNWFHDSAATFKSSTSYFWSNGFDLRVSGISRYRTNTVLKSGSLMNFENNSAFRDSTSNVYYPNTNFMRSSVGDMYYEGGISLFSSNTFRYAIGNTLISESGVPFSPLDVAEPVPFGRSDSTANNSFYIYLDTDNIARYGMFGSSGISSYVFGGTVDYAARNGDYTRDDTADAADYVLGRMTQGSTFNLTADGNANGTIDPADLDVWRAHFGQTLPAAAAAGSVEQVAGSAEQATSFSGDVKGSADSAEFAVSERLPHVAASLRDANGVAVDSTFGLEAYGNNGSTVDAGEAGVWAAYFGQTLPVIGAARTAIAVSERLLHVGASLRDANVVAYFGQTLPGLEAISTDVAVSAFDQLRRDERLLHVDANGGAGEIGLVLALVRDREGGGEVDAEWPVRCRDDGDTRGEETVDCAFAELGGDCGISW